MDIIFVDLFWIFLLLPKIDLKNIMFTIFDGHEKIIRIQAKQMFMGGLVLRFRLGLFKSDYTDNSAIYNTTIKVLAEDILCFADIFEYII